MRIIQNFDELATSPSRKLVLEIIEEGLSAVQPKRVLSEKFKLAGSVLTISDNTYELSNFKRVFLLGFGKGSSQACSALETILKDTLTQGFVIDVESASFSKIEFTQGSHPLPSKANINFTRKVIEKFKKPKESDLFIVVICGGGSALFEYSVNLSLSQLTTLNQALLLSGATITELNTVRKHLSTVKGGGLAKILYPGTVVSLVFSDVPGDDLSTIASGPTVKDESTTEDAWQVIKKYELDEKTGLGIHDLVESPKEAIYFEKVSNIVIVNSQTALTEMREAASRLGMEATILTDRFQEEAKAAASTLINATPKGGLLIAGGEMTVHVKGGGVGGRNQEFILSALSLLDDKTTIASLDSDGWDNSKFAGALGDLEVLKKARELNLDPEFYLKNNNSFEFFEKVRSGIVTGRLASNVSDFMIVYKQND